MAVAFCLECGNSIIMGARLHDGQRLICTGCGARLEVINVRPLELDWAYDEPHRNPWEDWEGWEEDYRLGFEAQFGPTPHHSNLALSKLEEELREL